MDDAHGETYVDPRRIVRIGAALLTCALTAACQTQPSRHVASAPAPVLTGTTWTALLLDDDFTQGQRPTLFFRADGRIHGTTGCEVYFGSVQLSGATDIRFLDLASEPGRQVCRPAARAQQTRFLKALQDARRVHVQAGRLLLLDGRKSVRLLFERRGSPPVSNGRRDRLAGLELATLTEPLGRSVGTDRGVLVTRAPPANDFGLRDGDVILSINGRQPANREHAIRIISSYPAGETLVLSLLREGVPLSFEIILHGD